MSLDFNAPLPAPGKFIESVRQSCAEARKASDIEISEKDIDSFIRGLSSETFERLKVQHGVNFPLKFTSIASEINFLSVLALLNTLSAYRKEFHEATGQGAYQNVMRLLMSMYISSPESDTSAQSKLSAQGLASLTESDVAELLGVPTHTERAHESIPGLVVGTKGGPLSEPIKLVVQICNDTGKRLIEMKADNLGTFVGRVLVEVSTETIRSGDAAGADLFVQKLVSAFPGFADMTTLPPNDTPVYLFKKAFFLLYALKARLPSGSAASSLQVPSPATLPMFVDNVIPTMLMHYRILRMGDGAPAALSSWAKQAQAEISDQSEQSQAAAAAAAAAAAPGQYPVEGPRLSKEDAYRVRAAALDAGTAIVDRIKVLVASDQSLSWLTNVTEADIDGYLWTVAKDNPTLRKVPRLVERGTVMY
ncbi:hypothetical protein OC846_002385 [Tilletia horrida]|uniref:Queuosine 5'-phosphate N-glycosylase/hydrolase n=1 Tax=Tilletia horrida TaxID=155126 RepID=A0AAN6GUH1_9BASI|nr:hypothetical protein OC845_002602 [Tilletia horrida]KAK0553727.1 hypothetical protein OC846_002385 [Tilletia horrida]KAK0567647.1 hypothetical protein OC861_002602 [Tilletia horrida]